VASPSSPGSAGGGSGAVLCALFFVSGAAALVFETLWFRLTGLAVGNGVWASSIVLGSLMAGLALGNLLAARRGGGLSRPVRAYGLLEMACGLGGLALVLLLPRLGPAVAALLGSLGDRPVLVNLCRLAIVFAGLAVPTTAMGATLPVLVRTLSRDAGFGPALGRLYGWNTLGAVAGAMGSELALIPALGLRGAGLAAAALNVGCGLGALALSRRLDAGAPAAVASAAGPARRPPAALLAAAALCGAAVLGLEVVWFRLLLLYVSAASAAFAVMLGVVLLGIGLGGLAGGRLLRAFPAAYRMVPFAALACGMAVQAAYAAFDGVRAAAGIGFTHRLGDTWLLALALMLPACALSGLLFTLIGRALDPGVAAESAAAGALTVANTAGAACGSLLTGFLLVPRLGVEGSLFVLSLAFGLAAALALPVAGGSVPRRRALAAAGLAFAAAAALFPFGAMARDHLGAVARRFGATGERVVALREGILETIVYMRRDVVGRPVTYRLVTNGFSMSLKGDVNCERYMRSYVYWPLAVHPRPRRALMISFGVGTTATALVESPELESITFVDISKDVLEMSRLGFPPPERSPLDDPRVRVHVEDGRFFLSATRERFDIVTAEPPPLQHAGVVNLYTREYFQLVHDRLAEQGIVTYWLPVYQLDRPSTLAVMRGFCDVFADCSLWSGSGLNWMLVGTRGLRGPVDEAHFRRLWRDGGALGRGLRDVGLETPAHLGATFMADADQLRPLLAGVPPLTDDRPHRLGPDEPGPDDFAFHFGLTDAGAGRGRFQASRFVKATWPAGPAAEAAPLFDARSLYDRFFLAPYGLPRVPIEDLRDALVSSGSPWLPLVLTGSHPREQAAADAAVRDGAAGPAVDYLLGIRALAARDYVAADARFRRVQEREPGFLRILDFRALTACLRGDRATAAALLRDERYASHPDPAERAFWSAMRRDCSETSFDRTSTP
jgi:spermidine synthase